MDMSPQLLRSVLIDENKENHFLRIITWAPNRLFQFGEKDPNKTCQLFLKKSIIFYVETHKNSIISLKSAFNVNLD